MTTTGSGVFWLFVLCLLAMFVVGMSGVIQVNAAPDLEIPQVINTHTSAVSHGPFKHGPDCDKARDVLRNAATVNVLFVDPTRLIFCAPSPDGDGYAWQVVDKTGGNRWEERTAYLRENLLTDKDFIGFINRIGVELIGAMAYPGTK